MTPKRLIAANWKMNKGLVESQKFAEEIRSFYSKNQNNNCEVVICPPFTSLEAVHRKLEGTKIKLGAQNVHFDTCGAYTGEISCSMLKSCGCQYVIVGHSERRQLFHETNELINKKVLKVLDEGLTPILCVGETLEEHQDHLTEAVIEEQLNTCLKHISDEKMENIVIAYEPVWAIGTGKNATPHQAESVHNFIRKKLRKSASDDRFNNLRIIYGGSVNPSNAKELFSSPSINGALVGGASLDEKNFIKIINSAY